MKQINKFEKQMLIYRINNLKNLGNKDFMVSFASIVNDYDLLQKDDYKNLQDHDWCRDSFKHEYTVIKALSKDVADALVKDKKDNTGRQRYYDNVFYLGGNNYLLSSEWYNGKGKKQDNKTNFVNWLASLVNERFQATENNFVYPLSINVNIDNAYRPYITAIKSKPFLLLAGISGTGKSRIVRELARACWEVDSEEYKASIENAMDKDLPLVLPVLEDYSPSKTGASPLDKATDWVNVTINGKQGKRETSTMPGSAASSWYFLRYIDPKNDKELAEQSAEATEQTIVEQSKRPEPVMVHVPKKEKKQFVVPEKKERKKRTWLYVVFSLLFVFVASATIYMCYITPAEVYHEETNTTKTISSSSTIVEKSETTEYKTDAVTGATIDATSGATPQDKELVSNEEPLDMLVKEVNEPEEYRFVITEELASLDLKNITQADTTLYDITGVWVEHKVVAHETLTRIALKYYGDKKLWPYIVKYNSLARPDDLSKGMKIVIPKLKPRNRQFCGKVCLKQHCLNLFYIN